MSTMDPYKQATNQEAVDPYKQATNRKAIDPYKKINKSIHTNIGSHKKARVHPYKQAMDQCKKWIHKSKQRNEYLFNFELQKSS